ncbi:hypothetical protein ACFX2A_006816 [Malus domestica]
MGGVDEFRSKLRKYAVGMGFSFVYLSNNKARVIAECSKKSSDGFDQIREKPSIKPIDIVKDVKQNYGLDISYYNAWQAKQMAKIEVHGDESLSYSQLAWYRDALISTNSGSYCVVECDPNTLRFWRLFVCYGACIEGFRWCRPLLFIDETNLKSKYKGQLIGAMGKNGNQGSFPFAFAIVDKENEENWRWFFENLAKVLTPQGRTITFVIDHNNVIDHNKDVIEAISNRFPTFHLAFCLKNLKENLVSKYHSGYGKFFRDGICDLFMKCAYAPTEAAFEQSMRNLKDKGGAPAKTFLETFPEENWSYAYFKGNRYGEMHKNIYGSFHSWISELYMMPICQNLEGIRIKHMVMMSEKSRESEQWRSILCPEMEKTLEDMLMVGRHWNVSSSSDSVFEVHADVSVVVDLDNHFCSCHEWQLKGFPCAHALVAVQQSSGCVYDYIDDYFKVSHYRSSYASPICPVTDIKDAVYGGSEDVVILPPGNGKGRPKTKKIKTSGEGPRAITCGQCGVVGRHNKTCAENS